MGRLVTGKTFALTSSRSDRQRKRQVQGKGKCRCVKFEEALPVKQMYRGDPEGRTSPMHVLLGWAVLDCGEAKSLARAELVATLAQACKKRGRVAGDDRKVEACGRDIPVSWNRRTGDDVIHQVASAWSAQRTRCITHTGSPMSARSIRRYPGDCWLELSSRGTEAKMMVTTSDHVLMNMAGFGDDREIDGDVLFAKRSHDDDNTSVVSVTEHPGNQYHLSVMQMLCPRSAEAEELTTYQDHQQRIIHLRSFS